MIRKTIAVLMITGLPWMSADMMFAAQDSQPNIIKRFAIAVGANNGGRDRVRLRYAVTDAEAFIRVLEDLGGVTEEDRLLLADPSVKSFYMEMSRFQDLVARSQPKYGRVEVFFYYSGHSDDEYILIGDEKISYKDLRETIEDIDADARIAILDSCASGAFNRIKGGKKRKPFLLDTAYNMRGFAFMSSSSATEVSQESDLIQGSFFTHYLISGMRGAADATQDGRVTLSEAYQFSFNETMTRTAATKGGPQHPYYDISMAGTGDVVMTDIRKSEVLLILSAEIQGKVFIHDGEGRLMVELTKPYGRPIELGLEKGDYRVINIPLDQVFESHITLKAGDRYELVPDSLSAVDLEYTTPRGAREQKLQRDTVLRGKTTYRPYLDLDSKSTSMYDEYALLMGACLGVTVNRIFSVGIAGYGKTNFVPGLPGFGGLFFAYTFYPERKLHFRATALAGSGTAPGGTIFYFFEPGVEAVLNLSSIVRVRAGLSLPLTDKDDTGLDNPILNVGFQFGK